MRDKYFTNDYGIAFKGMLLRTKGAHVGHREAATGARLQNSALMKTFYWLRLGPPWKGSSWTQNPGLHCM